MPPRNVLITGGCGFIGSNFVSTTHEAWPEANIFNLDKLILNSDTHNVSEKVRNSPRYRLVVADIKNREAIRNVLEENKIDAVIHFAADCTSTRCYNETIEAVENNVCAFIELLEVVKEYGKLERFLHISTDEVYGDSGLGNDEAGKVEHSRLLPGNPYAATKIAGEAYVRAFIAQHKLPIVTARMNNIYGPNQWDVKVVPRFIEIAKVKGEYTIQGSGQQLRSWLFVDDASEGIRAVFEKGQLGEIYNLGTYYEKNVAELARCIQHEVDDQLGRERNEPRYVSIPDRPYNDLRYFIDISKAEKDLGWTPTTTFQEGMRRTVAAALQPKTSVRMHVAIYGRGYVANAFEKVLELRNVPFVYANSKVGTNTDEEVERELVQLGVSHVACVTGRTHGPGCATIEYLEGGPDKAAINLRDNMYSATALAHICRRLGIHYTYVGTGYIFAYDKEHPIGGQGFKEEGNCPTFFGSSYSVVKGITDRQMGHFNQKGWENINARITLPLTYELDQPRNLLSKIINYKELFDIPVSISILPDCLDSLVTLMENRFGGNLNLVNPGPISLYQIVQLYKELAEIVGSKQIPRKEPLNLVDPNVNSSPIGAETERGRLLLATKGNCALDTELLQNISTIPTAEESLRTNFQRMANQNN